MNTLARYRFHKIPFTRELLTNERIEFPHLEEAFAGLMHSVEQRMSAALLAPAGTGKTALLRRLKSTLPQARYQVHYVKVTDLSKRDMCREIAAACGAEPAGSYPTLVRRKSPSWPTCARQARRGRSQAWSVPSPPSRSTCSVFCCVASHA